MIDSLQKLLREKSEIRYQQNCAFKLLKESLEDAQTMTYRKQFRKTRLLMPHICIRSNTRTKLEHSGVYKIIAYAS